MTAIGPVQSRQLRAIFGDAIPDDAPSALHQLEASPLAPTDPLALQALREAVLQAAGQKIDALAATAAQVVGNASPSNTTQRSLGGGVGARLSALNFESTADVAALEKVVSPERAAELFDDLKNAPIPHDFIDEGCLHRAHTEAKMLEDAGVFSEKIFLVPDASDLRINSQKHPLGFTLAMFHVAPTLFVDGPNGPERRVLDPSLGDGPLTVEEWSSKMEGLNKKPCETLHLPRFSFHLMDRKDPPEAWRQDDLNDAKAWNTQYKEVQDGMKEMGFYDHLKEMVEKAEAQGGQ
jgi:hypothetical protein